MREINNGHSQPTTSDEELRQLILRFIQLIAAEIAQRILSDKMLQGEKD